MDLTLHSPEDEEDDAAREHSALHAAKGAAKCGASTSELCLAIKLWHTGKKSGEAQAEKVFLDTFLTNVYINDGSNCAFLEIQDEEDNPLRTLVDCSPRQKGPKRRKRIAPEDRPWHPTNSSRPKAGPPRTKRTTIPTTTAPAPPQPDTQLGFQPEAEGGDLHAALPYSQPRIAGQIQEQEPPQRPRRSLAVVSYSEIAEISSDDEQGPTDRAGVAVHSPSAATLPISTDLRTRDDDAAAIIRNEPDPERSFSFVSRRYQPSSASSRAEEDMSCHTRHSGVSERQAEYTNSSFMVSGTASAAAAGPSGPREAPAPDPVVDLESHANSAGQRKVRPGYAIRGGHHAGKTPSTRPA